MSNELATIDYAVRYVNNDFEIIPLAPETRQPFKGFDASEDGISTPERAQQFWSDHPNAGIAIKTGRESRLVVVEMDTQNGGYESFCKRMKHHGGDLPKTWATRTDDSLFLYFGYPEVKGTVNISFREDEIVGHADGSYVPAPPSIHPDSKEEYKWFPYKECASLPRWLMWYYTTVIRPENTEIEDPLPRNTTSEETSIDSRFDRVEKQLNEGDHRNGVKSDFSDEVLSPETPQSSLRQSVEDTDETFSEENGGDPEEDDYRNLENSVGDTRDSTSSGGNLVVDSEGELTTSDTDNSSSTYTAAELMGMDLPEPSWLVESIIPEGLTILAGPPKVGKSFLVLQVAVDLTMGKPTLGDLCTKEGDVFYLALEDNKRRLQSRLRPMLQGNMPPEKLTLAEDCPALDEGGLEMIQRWVDNSPDPRLVIIDTLGKVKPKGSGGQSSYTQDYDALEGLKRLSKKADFGVIIVHHTNKRNRDDINDVLEAISGTNALSGSPDTAAILRKMNGDSDGELHVTGRDVPDQKLAVDFDANAYQWVIVGKSEEMQRSRARRDIIECLRESDEPHMGPTAVAKKLDKKPDNVKALMHKMAQQGELEKEDRGKYHLPPEI